jgi:hypothetical protein
VADVNADLDPAQSPEKITPMEASEKEQTTSGPMADGLGPEPAKKRYVL